MTLATWITLSRLLVVPILLFDLRVDAGGMGPTVTVRWICVVLFVVASLTDWLDGYIARRFDQITDLGKFLDPLVDKVLIVAPLVALVELRVIPAWTVVVVLVREFAIAGWRAQQPQVSGANLWGKAKTVVQIIAVALLIAPLPSPWPLIALGTYGCAILLTLISGAIYLWPTRPEPVGGH